MNGDQLVATNRMDFHNLSKKYKSKFCFETSANSPVPADKMTFFK